MIHFLYVANHTLFVYYLVCNLVYLTTLLIALKTSAAHQRKLKSFRLEWFKESPLVPPITLLTPAHNEEKSIRVSVRNMLTLDYPELEVIVINDGSADSTLDQMIDEFKLTPARAVYVLQVPCAPVRALYRSNVDPRLLVIDKESIGSKADAVNAGLNAATSPYVCVVDADSILERDALLRIMVPVMNDPVSVIGVGGIVRVLNGSEITAGRLSRVRLPKKGLEVIQVVEYLRAFLIGREAWAQANMLTIISGAFGLFRTDLVRAVNGFRAGAIGEDFDLVARLHRYMLDRKLPYRITFVPDPVCWTEVPSDPEIARPAARAVAEGADGGADEKPRHALSPRYGRIGWIALPYLWVFELFAPIIEIGGIFTILLAAFLGVLSEKFCLEFLIYGYMFATMISIGSVLQEEVTYKRYNDWQDVLRLVSYCFFEHFSYRQLHMAWRLQGMWQFMRGDLTWKPLRRQGMESAPKAG